jgi:hydrogenase expression/formation protein HypC
MCLAVPGLLVEWLDRDPLMARGWVEFEGLRRECHLACVPEARVGDYVLVHAGVALTVVDARQAEQTLRELRAAGEATSPPLAEGDA